MRSCLPDVALRLCYFDLGFLGSQRRWSWILTQVQLGCFSRQGERRVKQKYLASRPVSSRICHLLFFEALVKPQLTSELAALMGRDLQARRPAMQGPHQASEQTCPAVGRKEPICGPCFEASGLRSMGWRGAEEQTQGLPVVQLCLQLRSVGPSTSQPQITQTCKLVPGPRCH